MNRQALAIVIAAVFVDMIGFGIVMPVLPDMIVSLTGGSLASAARQAGWLGFAFATMQFVFAPLIGSLSDRFGRRPILLAALAAFAVDYFLTAFAPTLAWLFVGRIVAGMTGASFTIAYAYITDISAPEQRTQNFGLIGMAMGLGFIIGPSLGGLAANFGARAPFLLAGGLSLLNVTIGWFVLKESLSAENKRAFRLRQTNPVSTILRLRRNAPAFRIAFAIFLLQLGQVIMPAIWAFFAIERFAWSNTLVGLSLSSAGALSVVVRGGLIRLVIPKWGETRVVAVAVMVHVAALIIFAFGWQAWMMFAGILVDSLSGLALPTLIGLATRYAAANEQGELQGAIASLTSLATIIAPICASQLFSAFSRHNGGVYFPGAPFIFAAILWIAGYAVFSTLKTISPHSGNGRETASPSTTLAEI